MKVSIYPNKKKVYIKGDLRGRTPEQVIEEVFEQITEFSIEVERVSFTIIKNELNETTTNFT